MEDSIVNWLNENTHQKLEDLRLKIWELQKQLTKYGFDERRDLESYKVSDIKRLLNRLNDKREAIELINRIVSLTEEFYKTLYGTVNMEILNIDTDTPEKRTLMLKKWLCGSSKKVEQKLIKTTFSEVVEKIIDIINKCENLDECVKKVILYLREKYRRDYDRYRIVEYLYKRIGITPNLNYEKGSLDENVRVLVTYIKRNREG
jgi:hypothetical protein